MTLSIGVALWNADEMPLEQVFKQADDALYSAKHAGRNRVVVSGQWQETAQEIYRQYG